jgi:hypothetical protein
MELKEIELKDSESIEFVDVTPKYGRAEFVICAKYKNGKIVELFIYPAQQEDIKNYYVWRGSGATDLMIGCFHGLDNPKIWLFSYCKEHKGQSFRIYVPDNSKFLHLEVLSGINLNFTKTRVKR